MNVIDNFLDDKNFIKLSKILIDTKFPWYFNNSKSENNDGDFQFTHAFVHEKKILSPYWSYMVPILEKLNAGVILRVKANLTTKKEMNLKSEMHVDTRESNSKTAVYYPNTNNGGTLMLNGKKISSRANRIVIFDSHQKHCGVHCTDENIRLVINLNYFEKNK
tara:strand:+ start:389 stop:877 length:489 start_codon:yes stop_codon:yes gene_type:complete